MLADAEADAEGAAEVAAELAAAEMVALAPSVAEEELLVQPASGASASGRTARRTGKAGRAGRETDCNRSMGVTKPE